MKLFAIALTALCAQSAVAFAPAGVRPSSATALKASRNDEGFMKSAMSGIAAAIIATSAVAPDVALAFDAPSNNYDFAGSTELIAGRSGGRSGGRAGSGTRASYSSPAPARQTTIINNPAPVSVMSSPTVIVAPTPVYSYNPLGGLGFGLGAMNAVGNEIRDMNQEREIAQGRAELRQAQQREAEMEGRLRSLENQQMANQMAQQMSAAGR